jgi:hypothetical protein
VSRQSLESLERGFDRTLVGVDVNEPFDIIGLTRGLYLDGFGVVLTTETNLVMSTFSPFATTPDKAGIARLHQKKTVRLQILRKAMHDQLLLAGSTLKTVPPNEQVVLAVTLLYKNYEQRDGLPDQIVMQAPRQTLLDISAGRETDAAIKVQER